MNRPESTSAENSNDWYVLRHAPMPYFLRTARKTLDRFNEHESVPLELFAPTFVRHQVRNGRSTLAEVPLAYQYLFVRGRLEAVKRLCLSDNGYSLIIDRAGSDRYAMISDERMRDFQTIARAYGNNLPFFSLENVELESGDIVEIVNGDFPGLVGTYMPRPKSNTGNIVLAVTGKIGTVVYDVRADDVRVLQFAADTTRAYDQIDAFVPRMFRALRHHRAGDELPLDLRTHLMVFTRRMGDVRLDNHKAEAKLLALLVGATRLLGDDEGYVKALRRYERRKSALTNPWTRALAELIYAASHASAGKQMPKETADNLRALADNLPDPSSCARRALLDEYSHYLHTAGVLKGD